MRNKKQVKQIALIDYDQNLLAPSIFKELKLLSESTIFVSSHNQKELYQQIKDTPIILVKYFSQLDRGLLHKLNKLQYIGTDAITTSNISIDGKDIVVTNTAGYCTQSIAEFVFGALISYAREFRLAQENVSHGNLSPTEYLGWELQGKILGIIGLGRIGQKVAEIGKAFGMSVQYYSKTKNKIFEENGIHFVPLDSLFHSSNVIGIFLPDNNATYQIIDTSILKSINKKVTLLSISHTSVFDFDSLLLSIQNNKIHFIQTYFDSIPNNHKDILLNNKNVTLYPSIPIRTKEALKQQQDILLKNVKEFIENIS